MSSDNVVRPFARLSLARTPRNLGPPSPRRSVSAMSRRSTAGAYAGFGTPPVSHRDGLPGDEPAPRTSPVTGTAFAEFGRRRENNFLPSFTGVLKRHRRRVPAALKTALGVAPGLLRGLQHRPLLDWGVNGVLRGAGQVCFMNNPLSGALFIVGLGIGMPWSYTFLGLVGLLSSTAFAALLKLSWGALRSGLFGFNGLLCGYALAVLMHGIDSSPTSSRLVFTTIGVVISSLFAVVINVALGNMLVPLFKLPPLTLPFNFAALSFFLAVGGAGSNFLFTPGLAPSLPTFPNADAGAGYLGAWDTKNYLDDFGDFINSVLRGLSQVFLNDDAVSGAIVALGFLVCSPIACAFGLAGSTVGALTGMYIGASKDAIVSGLWGYNPALTAMAIGGMFFVLTWQSAVLALLGAVFTAVVHGALATALRPVGMPPLTLPFCVVTATFILLQRSLPALVPVALDTMTVPEEHRVRLHAAAEVTTDVVTVWKSKTAKRQAALRNFTAVRRALVLVEPSAEFTHRVTRSTLEGVLINAGFPAVVASSRALLDGMSDSSSMIHLRDIMLAPPMIIDGVKYPNAVVQALVRVLDAHMAMHPDDPVLTKRTGGTPPTKGKGEVAITVLTPVPLGLPNAVNQETKASPTLR